MLAQGIEQFKTEVYNILSDESVRVAFANALLRTLPNESGKSEEDRLMIKNFGDQCAIGLAGALTDRLCESIMKFIQTAQVTATPHHLLSPHGTVTGVIQTSETKVI